MKNRELILLEDGASRLVPAVVDGGVVRIAPATLRDALGWELKPQGFCKDDRCVPVGDNTALMDGTGVDLASFAQLFLRPLALDAEEGVAYLGASAAERGAQLASLEAPDFSLPDLKGQTHRLCDYRGKKILLVAYASW